MPALNFREIAKAHTGLDRDQFELFARDFLEAEGFEVVQGPDRGPDAGRDLVVREYREGPGGKSEFRWLVSCKHKAHSGTSVGNTDEENLRDRIETHACDGFIAFYSTVPSGTLATHLNALKPRYGLLIFDAERIETKLLDSPKGRAIAARYFPESFRKWIVSSQYASAPTRPQSAPIADRFFLREPHRDVATARSEAAGRGVALFIVIYDEEHSQRSRLDYCLGCFMEWESTKRLIDENFVVAVGPSNKQEFGCLVPPDDPLEEPRLVVLWGAETLLSESVYANATEGRKRVRALIGTMASAPKS